MLSHPRSSLRQVTSSTDVVDNSDRTPPADAEVVIDLRNVTRSYHLGETTVTALSNANLVVTAGEFVVVLGPSGCGKTTLLNMIGALDIPTSGEVTVAGERITGASRRDLFRYRRRTVSFVFQTFNLFPALTAGENVQFAIDVARQDAAGPTAAEVLGEVGLGERVDHFPHQLSGGEQQRVAIARALATGNPVLLADEPTGELDFRTGVAILELLRRQAQAGTTVIMVTHNREISRAADRVIELSSGEIVSDAPPAGGRVEIDTLHW
ncbi:MAG: ABC transporter ATP-binding protein [Acidimicrobiia bacterium]|nr:ABC transporter ATP-binding protein [Acidimicrobiia bacterium]